MEDITKIREKILQAHPYDSYYICANELYEAGGLDKLRELTSECGIQPCQVDDRGFEWISGESVSFNELKAEVGTGYIIYNGVYAIACDKKGIALQDILYEIY